MLQAQLLVFGEENAKPKAYGVLHGLSRIDEHRNLAPGYRENNQHTAFPFSKYAFMECLHPVLRKVLGLIESAKNLYFLSYCIECRSLFESEVLIKSCVDHHGSMATSINISGLAVFQDAVTEEDEAAVICFLDNSYPFPPWKESQSGRRKQDYGPRRNFKKKKIKPAEIQAMPLVFKSVFAAISSMTETFTGKAYRIAEVSALEYMEGKMSNFDPHIDDTWLWGDRIAGLNLNEASAVTFVDPEGVCCDVYLPRRAFFLMSGNCRYKWMHGIRPEHVRGRRISLTFRELSDEILTDVETSEMVFSAATTFL